MAKTQSNVAKRSEVQASDTWDLSPLFSSQEAWEEQCQEIEQGIEALLPYRGTLAQSLAQFEKALRLQLELSRSIERVYVYAHLKSDEDTSNSEQLALLDRAINLYSRLSTAASFLTPEILALDDTKLAEYLAAPSIADLKDRKSVV